MNDRERRDDFIRREYGQGRMSASQIGEALNMPRNSVISRARALGFTLKHGSPELHDRRSDSSRRRWAQTAKPAPAPKAEKTPKPERRDSGRMVWNNKSTIPDRHTFGETLRAVERVAARMAPKSRLCSWRTYEGDGRSLPCCESAEPGHMWCRSHLEQAARLKEGAA